MTTGQVTGMASAPSIGPALVEGLSLTIVLLGWNYPRFEAGEDTFPGDVRIRRFVAAE